MVFSGGGGKPCIQPRVSGSVSAAVGVAVGLEVVATDMSGLRGMMGNRNMEARRYAADVPARVTGAAGGCSPHERSDTREQPRVSLRRAGYACYSFVARDAFLVALRAHHRARSRSTARTVMGATPCNAMEAAPATSPLNKSNARSGPKYHMTPRLLSQGHRRQRWAKKENGKAPSVAGGAPEKIPVRDCQRTR